MTDERYTVEILPQPEFTIELNEQGPQGPAGPQGPQGVAGTVEVGNTYTLDYPEENRVENRGTSQSALLDFYLSRGPQGIQGPVGPSGGIYPVYNESTTTLEFYTYDSNNYILYPPQQVTKLSELENDVGYITSTPLIPIKNDVEANELNISSLDNRVTQNEGDISNINQEIGDIGTSLDDINGEVI